MEENKVNAYGSGIFFVSNNKTGNIRIDRSSVSNNIGGGWYTKFRGISAHFETPIEVTNSQMEPVGN
ncbi:hypothetical protein ACFSKV_11105 [Shivajiella indica]|uniref:Uncharacterized protein n=1 Tax=Shivajiella indica TaxID=872115 RepID=A0ABW5B9D6_9BACT